MHPDTLTSLEAYIKSYRRPAMIVRRLDLGVWGAMVRDGYLAQPHGPDDPHEADAVAMLGVAKCLEGYDPALSSFNTYAGNGVLYAVRRHYAFPSALAERLRTGRGLVRPDSSEGHDGDTLGWDSILDPGPEGRDGALDAAEWVPELLRRLKPGHSRVVKLYYGLSGAPGMTLRAIAAAEGLSHQRVQQRLKSSIKTMRLLLPWRVDDV